jgi:DTW domain-containing protein YfiP
MKKYGRIAATMNLADFQKQRESRRLMEKRYHTRCLACLRPESTCYCSQIQAFDPHIEFVILIHPVEFRRRLASGRMSHLCLEGSHLFQVANLSTDTRIDQLMTDPSKHCVVLYPGPTSLNLSEVSPLERKQLFPIEKSLVIFVIDGTWNMAGGMLRSHPKLETLPRICFLPPTPSNFRVRKQPKKECFSTLEAIHHCIELLGEARGFDVGKRKHDNLIQVFNHMVDMHLRLNAQARLEGRFSIPRKRLASLIKST